ncbi:DUF4815 domain-containing protein [Oxalobacter paraformigenes]|uniref:DUF4815 domain-containing protein n=1 Tax=Oxalobacter paraformigenes TaxID=556268 RepID=C3X348_9BURK|nr:DUF4815 domain-containing protein [Oxalobacter paraformigenes]EEO27634.1 hypothetical protein OFAG_00787 [Oxalobacter paraformigenes]
MAEQMPAGYFNRFRETDGYEEHLFSAGRHLQNAELNEIQSKSRNRLKNVADAVFQDGQVVRDATIVIDAETGETVCHSGAIYLRGDVRGVPEAVLTIPVKGKLTVGIRLIETVITAKEDKTLLNPAVNSRTYQKPGADRLKVTTEWGYEGDGKEGDYYPVYYVQDAQIIRQSATDSIEIALAQYDRDSAGGTYVTDGMVVSIADDTDDGRQTYVVAKGRARVHGSPVTFYADKRVEYDAQPSVRRVSGETHTAVGGTERIEVVNKPISTIEQVLVKSQKSVSMTRGLTENTSDKLPDTSVLSIVSIEGYTQGTDYRLVGNTVDWSLSGSEPSSGTTYNVEYLYWHETEPTDLDSNGFTVSGAAAGDGNIMLTYSYCVPRVDRLCLNKDGELVFIKGLASDYNAKPARISDELLGLALIYQTWDDNRYVETDGARMVPMSDLAKIQSKLDRLLVQVAQQALRLDASMRETDLKKSLFVDPLTDNDMRDAGLEQNAAICNEMLMLAIPLKCDYFTKDPDQYILSGSLVTEVEQLLKTGSMKINQYMAYVPDAVTAALDPAVDRYVETVDERTGYYGGSNTYAKNSAEMELLLSRLHDISLVLNSSSTTTTTSQYLRQIDVSFTVTGLQPHESLTVKFDGITVPTSPASITGDVNGIAAGKFTIPKNVLAGTKQVDFIGVWGSEGHALFTGSYTIVTTVKNYTIYDPLSQTFRVTERCQIGAVEIWLTAKGETPITVQIRETANGYPTNAVLAEATINTNNLTTDQFNRFTFRYPVTLSADTDYALTVLCNDSDSEIAIAQIGKADTTYHQWVTAQPYQIGVLLSSSNAVTWTAHQDMDMTFRLLRYEYSENTHTVDLGDISLPDTSDLLLLGVEETPDEVTRVDYQITAPDGTVHEIASDQTLQLPAVQKGNFGVKAVMYGNDRLSPILYPDGSIVHGNINQSGTYITRAMKAGENSRVRIIYDADLPTGSVCKVSLSVNEQYIDVPVLSTLVLDDGWIETTHEIKSVNEDFARTKIELSGNTAARPFIRNIRVMVM